MKKAAPLVILALAGGLVVFALVGKPSSSNDNYPPPPANDPTPEKTKLQKTLAKLTGAFAAIKTLVDRYMANLSEKDRADLNTLISKKRANTLSSADTVTYKNLVARRPELKALNLYLNINTESLNNIY